jgi:DNA-binding MarR family transcriptional regulator
LELDPGCPRPMRRLAERLGNDASNVTGIADRLEDRGLVERRPSEDDRRVKALAVTRDGEALRERFVARLKEAPSPITRLAPEDRRALRDILRSVVGDG